jgi:hypothetical protein
MRSITVKTPQGQGESVADIAFGSGVTQLSIGQVLVHRPKQPPVVHDEVKIDTTLPLAREFVDQLLSAPFFDPGKYTVSISEPASLITHEPPSRETMPVVTPAVEIFEELWQFSHVTVSHVGRVFLAALLVSYGMIEMHIPLMIAGLLFLPYHHPLLSIGFGLWTREWRLLRQGAWTFLVSTALIVLAGAAMAAFLKPPLEYQKFGTLLTGFVISLIIGTAAAIATSDDAGRKELIGLAATAHLTVLPAWFGISLVFGFPDTATTVERITEFGINTVTITLAATAVFASLKMRGGGLRRVSRRTSKAQ